MRRSSSSPTVSTRRVGVAALIALSLGLVVLVVGQGFSSIGVVRALEDVALGVLRRGGADGRAWRSWPCAWPAGATRSPRASSTRSCATPSRSRAKGWPWRPDESEFMELDPLDDSDFEELVRDALDDLPDLLRNALAHVAVVISDGGRRRGAYGLYQGDGATRDNAPRPDRDLPRHAAAGLRPRPRAAARPGHAHRAPRARPPRRLRRARRQPPGSVAPRRRRAPPPRLAGADCERDTLHSWPGGKESRRWEASVGDGPPSTARRRTRRGRQPTARPPGGCRTSSSSATQKCGTTALYLMLRQPPADLHAGVKEPRYFAPDLRSRYSAPPASRRLPPDTLEGYRSPVRRGRA